MAYNPTQWKDRVVERPRTYSLQDNGDGTYTLLPMPGNIIEPGTPVNAGNMNKIEQGIADTSQGLEQHINANTGVHGATPNATPSRIVMRDGNGRAAVANPVNNNHIANKQYVDDAADAAEQAAIDWVRERGIGSPGQTIDDLNNATEPGRWYVAGSSTANTPDGLSWWTVLVAYRNSSNLAQIAFRTISGATQTKIRFLSGGTWTEWGDIWTSFNLPNPVQTTEFNAHVNATSAHGATSAATANRIVMRDGNGRAAVANPVNNNHIANKQYVDDAADAAEQAAIDWVRERGIGSPGQTIDDLNNATEPGRWYVAGSSTANTPDGLSWWTVLVAYRNSSNLAQIAFRTISGATQTKIRFLSGGTWTSWENIWTSFNLPNPARTDVDNNFSNTQTIRHNGSSMLQLERTGSTYPTEFLIHTGYGRFNIASGTSTSDTRFTIAPNGNVGIGTPYTSTDPAEPLHVGGNARIDGSLTVGGHEAWSNGNQGNPNNLNTSSKQIVGAINEAFNRASAQRIPLVLPTTYWRKVGNVVTDADFTDASSGSNLNTETEKFFVWDAQLAVGRSVYFEAIIAAEEGSDNLGLSSAYLVRKESGVGTPITSVSTRSTTPVRVRSGTFTLQDGREYFVTGATGSTQFAMRLYAAWLVII